jgi:hypothetical protein
VQDSRTNFATSLNYLYHHGRCRYVLYCVSSFELTLRLFPFDFCLHRKLILYNLAGMLRCTNRLAVPICSPHGCSASVLHGLFCAYLAFAQSFRSCLLLQIIMFSDLECDYINPIDLCNKLNQVSCTRALWSLTYARILYSLSCPKT